MPKTQFKRGAWKAPVELRAHRSGLIAFGVMAVLLLLLGRAENSVVDQVRTDAADVASTVIAAGSDAAGWVAGGVDAVAHAVFLYGENDRLRAENNELLLWRAKAMELERQVRSFESILNISYVPIEGVVTASVIAETGGPFSRAIVVKAGHDRGVRPGDAALDRYGLVGRVIDVGRTSSRVLLLTDTTSHVPVVIEPGGIRAVLSGDADGRPQIQFLPIDARLQEGAAIVTSGDGGVLPPGLPVGVVTLKDKSPAARLYADIARVEVVALKRYEFQDDLDIPALPPPEFETPVFPAEGDAVAANPAPRVE
jgi:rod shape-determining protein MreC